ncbi:hypothetical protein ACHAXN_009394 [Cyclotella atomus]
MIANKRHHSQRHPPTSRNHRTPLSSRRTILLTASLLILPNNYVSSFSFPSSSSSSTPPITGEQIVQTQLSHYKTSNLSEAFKLCSPWFQDTTGTLSDFESAINESPYNLLLNHERADILLETIQDVDPNQKEEDGSIRAEAACYLVCVKPGAGAESRYPVWFWWEVSRHYFEEEEELEDEDVVGEWRVDCVMPDFEDLEFEAESLVQFFEEDEEEGGPDFFMDFAEDDEEEDDDEYD